MKSNSIRIHIRQKIAGNSKCIYSRAHGLSVPENAVLVQSCHGFSSPSCRFPPTAPWRVAGAGKGKGTGAGKGSPSRPWKMQTMAERCQCCLLLQEQQSSRVAAQCLPCHQLLGQSSAPHVHGEERVAPKPPRPADLQSDLQSAPLSDAAANDGHRAGAVADFWWAHPLGSAAPKDLHAMTLAELKQEFTKVTSLKDSLIAACMPDASKAVETRLLFSSGDGGPETHAPAARRG